MKRLTWIEYCMKERECREKLECLIKKIYKIPGSSVDFNTVESVLKKLAKDNTYTEGDVTIKLSDEKVQVLYKCSNECEINNLKDIVCIDNLDVVISATLTSFDVEINNCLGDVLTCNEAAEKYNILESKLRRDMKTGKLQFGRDYRKAGRITLITKEAMEREYC